MIEAGEIRGHRDVPAPPFGMIDADAVRLSVGAEPASQVRESRRAPGR